MKKRIERIGLEEGGTYTEQDGGLCSFEQTEEQELEGIENIEEEIKDESSRNTSEVDFSFCSLISVLFFILLITAAAYKIIFPAVDSFQANITNKKIGKSIVYNYFNLLETANYAEALNLLDVENSDFDIDSLTETLEKELGTTNIVDCNILSVFDNKDYSIVKTIVSYINQGKINTKNQEMLVKNTPEGWKISLNGIIKQFKLDPVSAAFGEELKITLDEIEYCIEGINLKMHVKNNTYSKVKMNGKFILKTENGSYTENINTFVKSKVKYNHNLLFNTASGEPTSLKIDLQGRDYTACTLPVSIKR